MSIIVVVFLFLFWLTVITALTAIYQALMVAVNAIIPSLMDYIAGRWDMLTVECSIQSLRSTLWDYYSKYRLHKMF